VSVGVSYDHGHVPSRLNHPLVIHPEHGTVDRTGRRAGLGAGGRLMSKRNIGLGAVLAVGLGAALAGCEEPAHLVPAVPPGRDYHELTALKEEGDNAPQALGETAASSAGQQPASNTLDIPPAAPTAKGEVKTTASGVKYETLKEGTGAVAKAGERVTVHYVGTLDDGRKFDSSRDKDAPATFMIGTGSVIKGWDEAVPGMRIGEIRKLTIPPTAGYGAQGRPPAIPPNATLVFEIELLNVQ
jgi:FKBP-type peptidyl-prolyl cis-trans isomerase FkpA